jgi:hypothetical protein
MPKILCGAEWKIPSPKVLLCWWRGLWSSIFIGTPVEGHVYNEEGVCVTCGRHDEG